MSTYVIEVRLEDAYSDTVVLYGPYRSHERAITAAAKIGEEAGLNRNTWGIWAGTDGAKTYAFVKVRTVLEGSAWAEAVHNIRKLFDKARLGAR